MACDPTNTVGGHLYYTRAAAAATEDEAEEIRQREDDDMLAGTLEMTMGDAQRFRQQLEPLLLGGERQLDQPEEGAVISHDGLTLWFYIRPQIDEGPVPSRVYLTGRLRAYRIPRRTAGDPAIIRVYADDDKYLEVTVTEGRIQLGELS